MLYDITPVPKPRMTQRDKFKKRPAVLRYWAFKEECRLKMVGVSLDRADVLFWMPMPKSWSQSKKRQMVGQPHRAKPDLDNLLKGLGDALYGDDSVIAEIKVAKLWANGGSIQIVEDAC